MNQFVKIYGSIIRSTVWQTPAHVKLTWVTMLILADSDGCVASSIPGLAVTAGVTTEQCEEALAIFMAPDRYSRTKEHEGRRIEEIAGGWRVLNHGLYRDLRTPQQQQKAVRQRRWEESRKASGNPVKRVRRKPAQTRPDATDTTPDAQDTTPDAADGQNVSAVRSRRARRPDPDPDPDPDPNSERDPNARGREPAPAPAPAPAAQLSQPAAPSPAPSPEYSNDDEGERTWSKLSRKPPLDYEPLERHAARCEEFGLNLLEERDRFRTHEYPRDFSDWDRRFDRWLLDAKTHGQTRRFQERTGRGPRGLGGIRPQPTNGGATGWESTEDEPPDESPPTAAPVRRAAAK